jgi:hypothetical protein
MSKNAIDPATITQEVAPFDATYEIKNPVTKRDQIAKLLGRLVKDIYGDCVGQYGEVNGCLYEGQYEKLIGKIADAVCLPDDPVTP